MRNNTLYFAICCLVLLAPISGIGQATPEATCSPCKLIVSPGLGPLSITYDLIPAPDKRQLIRHLLVSQDGKRVQQLVVHGEVSLSPGDTPSFRGIDLNADGFQDIEFVTSQGAANTYADYWLYNPSRKQFSYLGNYPVFAVDPQTHRLKTYERNGEGGMSYSARQYAFLNGKLELMRSETQEEASTDGLFKLTVKERLHGVLKTTLRKTVKPPA